MPNPASQTLPGTCTITAPEFLRSRNLPFSFAAPSIHKRGSKVGSGGTSAIARGIKLARVGNLCKTAFEFKNRVAVASGSSLNDAQDRAAE